MRFKWLLLSGLSVAMCALPVNAGQLVSWRFDQSQNRLLFNTNSRVQPKAFLITNPTTRLVVDLEGINLRQPTVHRSLNGAMQSLRIGQFDNSTTRLVIELKPGYTIDPQRVVFRGANPQQWSVQLPAPQRIGQQPTFN